MKFCKTKILLQCLDGHEYRIYNLNWMGIAFQEQIEKSILFTNMSFKGAGANTEISYIIIYKNN